MNPHRRTVATFLWAAATCLMAFGRGVDASVAVGPGVCSWNPLLQQQHTPPLAASTCTGGGGRPNMDMKGEPSYARGGNGTKPLGEASVDETWLGPHACTGDHCVYSRPGFDHGRDLVVISTARSAESLAGVLDGVQASTNVRACGVHDKKFVEKDIPGKGKGLVASRLIRRGELILDQRPLFIIDRDVAEAEDDVGQLRLYDSAISQLPAATAQKFLSQAVQGQGDGDGEGARARTVKDIILTNSFNLGGGAMKPHVGNYLDVSRLNHDCRPNLAYHISSNLSHVTHAARDILPGEELTISYLDSFRVHEVRQARAMRNWGFACTCSQCSLPKPLVDASDDRLWRIYQLENRLQDWSSSSSEPASPEQRGWREGEEEWGGEVGPDAVETLLSLYGQENLEFAMASAYTLAAESHNSFGRAELAVKYALLALDASIIEHGAGSTQVQNVKALLQDPQAHWTWRRRAGASHRSNSPTFQP